MLSLYLILIYSNTFNEILLFVFKYHLTNVKFTNILDLKVSKTRKGDILIISFLILVFFLNKMLVHSKIITFIKPKASWTFLVRCLCVCLSSDFNKSSHVILPKSFLFRFGKEGLKEPDKVGVYYNKCNFLPHPLRHFLLDS